MMGFIVGIDNGVSGSISTYAPDGSRTLQLTPTKVEQNYQKKAKNITRIDHDALGVLLAGFKVEAEKQGALVHVVMEKPFVNPGNFVATSSSLRAHEATLVILEQLGIGHQFLDAPEWQKKMLPVGTRTRPEQKKASRDVGTRQFPEFASIISKIKDADGLLICEYARLHL